MSLRRRANLSAIGGGLILAFAGCQVIAGLQDRSEGPVVSTAPATGGSGGGSDIDAAAGAAGMTNTAGHAGKGATAGAGGSIDAGGSGGAGGMSTLDAGDAGDAHDAAVNCTLPAQDPDASVSPPLPFDDGGKPSNSPAVTFAVHEFFFGSVDLASGQANPSAWKSFGFDLDHLCSQNPTGSAPPGSCQPMQMIPDQLDDGNECRDNNFGRFFNTLPLSSASAFERNVNMRIDGGETTLAIEIDDLDSGTCDDYAPAKIFVLAPAGGINGIDGGSAPEWVGTDVRVVDDRSLEQPGMLAKPLVMFTRGFMRDNVWTSGPLAGSAQQFLLPIGTYLLSAKADQVVLTLTLSADHSTVMSSTIASVVSPLDISESLQNAANTFTNCLAPEFVAQTFSSLVTFSDLTGTPTLQDPSMVCDRLSMGLGLAWRRILPLTSTVMVPPPTDNPCDAGVPDAGDGGGGKSGAAGAAGAAGKGGA